MPYEIKPLEWERDDEMPSFSRLVCIFSAKAPPPFNDWINVFGYLGSAEFNGQTYPDADAAKLAAQRWHDSRLLPALREVQP